MADDVERPVGGNGPDILPHDEVARTISYLTGEAPNADGEWFGEAAETERGNFWWRRHLYPILASHRTLSTCLAEAERERDEARAARAAVVEQAVAVAVELERQLWHDVPAEELTDRQVCRRITDAILALASGDDWDALAERDARIRAEVWEEVIRTVQELDEDYITVKVSRVAQAVHDAAALHAAAIREGD